MLGEAEGFLQGEVAPTQTHEGTPVYLPLDALALCDAGPPHLSLLDVPRLHVAADRLFELHPLACDLWAVAIAFRVPAHARR